MEIDNSTLASAYERGRLVPFVGSGMSIGACVGWSQFVSRLEQAVGVSNPVALDSDLAGRAATCLQTLRLRGASVSEAIRASLYTDAGNGALTHCDMLAKLVWPIICTTNYDDVYLRCANEARGVLPRVYGRSEQDCRRVLQHLALPAGEIVWALQGFLSPRDKALVGCVDDAIGDRLESELVVGHKEYRQAAHRALHFRRCFAELFRNRSLLFLGSGLEESYFRTLFDEIIELGGPPAQPHFAVVEEGKVDEDLLLKHYHIICTTYPRKEHGAVSAILRNLTNYLEGRRTRPLSWAFRLRASAWVTDSDIEPDFAVVRAPLPKPEAVGPAAGVAIRCGRDRENSATANGSRGIPLLGASGREYVPTALYSDYEWQSDWTVAWKGVPKVFGIVARHLNQEGLSSRDARDLEAVRRSFKAFLGVAQAQGTRVAHVQLLAAGTKRVFHPWISLVQMARAYGQWAREGSSSPQRVRVYVHVVAPDLIALLNAGHLHLGEHLENNQLRIQIEVIDAFGQTESTFALIDDRERIGRLPIFALASNLNPTLQAIPPPTLRSSPTPLSDINNQQVRDFGLVSGSTLVVDYRNRNAQNANGHG